jgi:hypothetical protein
MDIKDVGKKTGKQLAARQSSNVLVNKTTPQSGRAQLYGPAGNQQDPFRYGQRVTRKPIKGGTK